MPGLNNPTSRQRVYFRLKSTLKLIPKRKESTIAIPMSQDIRLNPSNNKNKNNNNNNNNNNNSNNF